MCRVLPIPLAALPAIPLAILLAALLAVFSPRTAHAQSPGPRPLDHEAYARWNSIRDTRLSERGHFVLYRLAPVDGADGELVVYDRSRGREHRIARGASARFDYDERFAVCLVSPEREAVRAAKKDKEKKADPPESGLGILELATGEVETIERVKSFALPDRSGRWLAYLRHEPSKKKDAESEEEEAKGEQSATSEEEKEPEEPTKSEAEPEEESEPEEGSEPEEESEAAKKKKKRKNDGTDLVLVDLESGGERTYPNVIEYEFADDGRRLAFLTSTKEEGDDGAFVLELGDNVLRTVFEGEGEYRSLAFDEAGDQLALLTNQPDYAADDPRWTLVRWHADEDAARVVATAGADGVPDGAGVSQHRAPSFSESGRRLLFGTAPLPPEEPPEIDDEDRVTLDVWNWRDARLQPTQLVGLEREKKRSYLAVAHLSESDDRVVALGSAEIPDVTVGDEGDGRWALGVSDRPYCTMVSWDGQVYTDAYAIDVMTGAAERLVERRRGRPSLSPSGRFLSWWDYDERAWFGVDIEGEREAVDLTGGLPHAFHNEEHDSPSHPRSYGSGGWLAGDEGLLVYDRHDVWLLDPRSKREPRCVTDSMGRKEDRRFRIVDLDLEEPALDPGLPLLLELFDYRTKAAGFFRDDVWGRGAPERLIESPHRYSTPRRARNGEVVHFTRESFAEFPDVWAAPDDFEETSRISDANPQQGEYRWGSAELVDWVSTDGTRLEGILYQPEGFDPSQRYPMLTYFYERSSQNLHAHHDPSPHRSVVRIPFYTSRGYVVFVPDIRYRVGYPGESAVHAVLSGILKVLEGGFVDRDRIGVQGHSWGGYQIAYLVTQTNLFRAAVAGAPVSNMTSAYGGIRWGSGMSRMFQYERTQSRIGATLWEATQRYLENSPVFFADKVETPLMMMHNDQDGAVPWYQGIEMFVALRRLGKPAWLLNYNDEKHGLTRYAHKRDYAIRMQQFFDHYLKDAPPPRWLAEGIPAVDKGRDLGLDLVGEDQ